MRQACNVAFAVQVEGLSEEDGTFQKWLLELETPPAGYVRPGPRRSYIAPELDALMAPGGGF